MIRRTCYLSLTLALMACGQRKEPPAPVSYGMEDSTTSEDFDPVSPVQSSGSMLSYIDPQKEITPTIQQEQIVVVKPQENLDLLAERYQIDREEIIAQNNLMAPYYLFPGQNLKLPATARPRPISLKKMAPKPDRPVNSKEGLDTSDSDENILVSQKEQKLKKDQQPRSVEDREKELEDKFSKLEADLKASTSTKSSKKSDQKEESSEDPEDTENVKIPAKKPSSLTEKNNDKSSSKYTEKSSSSEESASVDDPEPKGEASADKALEKDKQKVKNVESASDKTSDATSFTLASPLAGQIKDKIVNDFNQNTGKVKNDGINIKADKNAPILAAQSGQVVYAGNEMQGFGNLILLKHEGGWMTAYGHCAEILVKEKQFVKQGETIAKVGNTGSVRDSQLHFQLRKKSTVIDPKLYLE